MRFMCQDTPLSELRVLAESDRHSVLIEGPEGSGKSYLARQYASMLGVSDFLEVAPKVEAIKDTIDSCLQINNKVVICVENLDCGVVSASYTLLKFLEEPLPNVYIVITCRNVKHVPDTIISRSAVVNTCPPVDIDISSYSLSKNPARFKELQNTLIWRCVRTFKDAETVLNMTSSQLSYFQNLVEISKFNDSVSNLIWNIGHYPDNTDTPVELVIRYLMELVNTSHIRKAGISCIRDLGQARIASHAVLAKFVFEAKYCE